MNNQETMDVIESTPINAQSIDETPNGEASSPMEETVEGVEVEKIEEIDGLTDTVAEEEMPSEQACAENEEDPPLSREELYSEIERLRAELEETKALHARMANELDEFHLLFPDVNTACIPESIWEQVKNGIPLAASYALYEKKCNLRRQHAEEINLHNAKHTPGAAGKNTPAEYFSPDEVRRMSQSEVRSNYQKIMESMKKWNR